MGIPPFLETPISFESQREIQRGAGHDILTSRARRCRHYRTGLKMETGEKFGGSSPG